MREQLIHNLKLALQDWLIYFPYTLAPALLMLGGIFLVWEANHSWWKGALPEQLAHGWKLAR